MVLVHHFFFLHFLGKAKKCSFLRVTILLQIFSFLSKDCNYLCTISLSLGLKKKNNLLKIKSEYCFYCSSPSTCPKHVHIKFSQKFLPESFPRMASLWWMTGSGMRLHMLPASLFHRERLTISSLLSQLQENQNANS